MKKFLKRFSYTHICLLALAFASEAASANTDASQLTKILGDQKPTPANGDGGGAGSTGGGDERALLESTPANQQPDPRKTPVSIRAGSSETSALGRDFRHEFVHYARMGVSGLEKYALIGWTFPNGARLSKKQIRKARKIIDQLEDGDLKFVLDLRLTNPKTGEPRLAQNSEDGVFTLNPVEWDGLLKKYTSGSVELIRAAVGAHEVFQQPSLRLEGTGNFNYTGLLMRHALYKETEPRPLASLEEDTLFKVGLIHQVYCHTPTGNGWLELEEVSVPWLPWRKVKHQRSFFDVRNSGLCRRRDGDTFTRLTSLAYDNAFSTPEVVTVAIHCEKVRHLGNCYVTDFQLRGEDSIEPYYQAGKYLPALDFRSDEMQRR